MMATSAREMVCLPFFRSIGSCRFSWGRRTVDVCQHPKLYACGCDSDDLFCFSSESSWSYFYSFPTMLSALVFLSWPVTVWSAAAWSFSTEMTWRISPSVMLGNAWSALVWWGRCRCSLQPSYKQEVTLAITGHGSGWLLPGLLQGLGLRVRQSTWQSMIWHRQLRTPIG